VDSKAEFIITMDWPDNHPDDLDLFVQDPAGNIAWHRHREAGFMVLERDDRGGANDFIIVNGKKISSPIREEIVTIRGVITGEYTVNVSHFLATTGLPVPATVKVQKLNPTSARRAAPKGCGLAGPFKAPTAPSQKPARRGLLTRGKRDRGG